MICTENQGITSLDRGHAGQGGAQGAFVRHARGMSARPHQLARRAAVSSCLPAALPEATDAASSCCYLRAGISATGGPQRAGVYVQFKIQALPHFPLEMGLPSFPVNTPKKNRVTGWYKSRRRRYGSS